MAILPLSNIAVAMQKDHQNKNNLKDNFLFINDTENTEY